jgi:hypothetical protein
MTTLNIRMNIRDTVAVAIMEQIKVTISSRSSNIKRPKKTLIDLG